MVSKDGRVAVIGASMAGLLAARGLADIASEVLIIERDALPEQPAAKIVAIPWQIAAGGDFSYPEATGPRPPLINVLNFYLRKAIVAAQHDPVVAIAIANVQNLLAPPPSLLRPQIALRVWKNGRRSPSSSGGHVATAHP
jgi:hypothetical protein